MSAFSKIKKIVCLIVLSGLLTALSGCTPELLLGGMVLASVAAEMESQNSIRNSGLKGVQNSSSYSVPKTSYISQNTGSAQKSNNINTPPAVSHRTVETKALPKPPVVYEKADPSPTEACLNLSEKATQSYRDLEWQNCSVYSRSILDNGSCSTQSKYNASLLMGAIAFQDGYTEQAREYFVKAKQFDKNKIPSAEVFPPILIDFYRKAQAK